MNLENPGFNPQATSDKFEKNAESGLLFREEEHLLKNEQDQELKNELQDINEKLKKLSQEYSKLSAEGDYFDYKEQLKELLVSIQDLKAEKQEIENTIEKLKEKKEKIILEIEGRKIEGEKYYFEYPEKVQEETGILGYERIKIPRESLKGCDIYNVFSELSNHEYPNRCFNHIFSKYVNEDYTKNEYFNEFKKSKFFLQKIFSVDSRSRLGLNSYRHQADGEKRTEELIDKQNNKICYNSRDRISYDDPMLINEYQTGEKDLKKDDKWLFSEMNIFTSQFWGSWYTYKSPSLEQEVGSMAFGFSMNDSFLKEYLEESLKSLKDIEWSDCKYTAITNRVDASRPLHNCNGLAAIIYNLLYFDKKIQDYLFEIKSEKIDIDLFHEVVDEAFTKLEERTSFPISKYLSKYDYSKEDITLFNKDFKKQYETNGFNAFKTDCIQGFLNDMVRNNQVDCNGADDGMSSFGQSQIPIFIGHDTMPQLSWGHAKYAHLLDEKNLNFLTFEHEDYLSRE